MMFAGLKKKLIALEQVAPPVIGRCINFLRKQGDYRRRFLGDPIRTIPELRPLVPITSRINHGSAALDFQETAKALALGVAFVHNSGVPGDIAEFGTFCGRTARVIAAAMASYRRQGTLHLFDSFEGLPASDEDNPHIRSGVWKPGQMVGARPSTLESICRKYLPRERIRIHRGWFKDSLATLPADTTFAMVHLDCDLYISTMDALAGLDGRLADGALVFFDDWSCNGASPDHGQRKAFDSFVFSSGCLAPLDYYSWGAMKAIYHRTARQHARISLISHSLPSRAASTVPDQTADAAPSSAAHNHT